MSVPARSRRVARLLLFLRGVVICALPLAFPAGCVLPLAPDFQDPPASENYAPVIVKAEPDLGSIVTTIPKVPQTFSVTFSDPNVTDDLTVRFLIDYPPDTIDTRPIPDHVVPHSTGPQLSKLPLTPDCVLNALAKIPTHQIMVVISDRGFLAPQVAGDLTRIPEGGHSVTGSWILNLECP